MTLLALFIGTNGGVNAGFTGVRGTTRSRDGHADSCCAYSDSGEMDFDTSGEDILIFGK